MGNFFTKDDPVLPEYGYGYTTDSNAEAWARVENDDKWHLYAVTTHRGYRTFFVDGIEVKIEHFDANQVRIFTHLSDAMGWFVGDG